MISKQGHPRADKNHGYVLEHIVVMEEVILKRPLKVTERVHHNNGIRSDNRPFNLRYFATQSEHNSFHMKQRWAIKRGEHV